MLKKLLSVLFAFSMTISLFACGKTTATVSNDEIVSNEERVEKKKQTDYIYWYKTDGGTTLHLSATKPSDSNYDTNNLEYLEASTPIWTETGYAVSDEQIESVRQFKANVKTIVIDNEIYPVTCKGFFQQYYLLENIYNLKNLKTEFCADFSDMFKEAGIHTPLEYNAIDISSLNTKCAVDMSGMFQNFKSNIINVSNFDTRNVENMERMFYGCDKIDKLDLSGFDTSNVKNMNYMFMGCSIITDIDISSFDFSSIEIIEKDNNKTRSGYYEQEFIGSPNICYMFGSCNELQTIYSNKDIIVNGSISNMYVFHNSKNIIGGNGTAYNENHLGIEMACVDSIYQAGYFTYDSSRYYWKNGCYYINGKKQVNKWITDKYDKYYVDNDGKPVTNVWKDGYYLGQDGKMLKNTKTPDGKYVNYEGSIVDITTDFANIDQNTVLANSWYRTQNGVWYYYENDRTTLKRGWFVDPQDSQTYYLEPETGIMVTGWYEIDGDNYYFNERGSSIPNWYYDVSTDTWASYGKKVKSLGSMFRDEETPDGKRVDAEGKLIN